MKKIVFLMYVTAMLSTMGAKADVIPASYYSDVDEGSFYLYNVTQEMFLGMNGSGDPILGDAGTLMTLTADGEAYKLSKAEGKDLKVGHWNGQLIWCNGASDGSDAWKWYFEAKGIDTYLIYVELGEEITENGYTFAVGRNYLNSNTEMPISSIQANEWALITESDYVDYQMSNAIPVQYRSTVADGSFYLYDAVNRQFFNTATRTFTATPEATVTITKSGDNYLISGSGEGYLKIGVWRGQYLWSDGDATSTFWTVQEDANRLYYISTSNFTETNEEVAGKTWYLTGSTNVTQAKPSMGQWAFITEANYANWQNGEATNIKNVDDLRFETGTVYDLQGRKVSDLSQQRRIYIINGKKIMVE